MENPIKELLAKSSVISAAKLMKLNPNTVRQISRMTVDDIGGVKIGTAMQIYELTGINLWEYFMSLRSKKELTN